MEAQSGKQPGRRLPCALPFDDPCRITNKYRKPGGAIWCETECKPRRNEDLPWLPPKPVRYTNLRLRARFDTVERRFLPVVKAGRRDGGIVKRICKIRFMVTADNTHTPRTTLARSQYTHTHLTGMWRASTVTDCVRARQGRVHMPARPQASLLQDRFALVCPAPWRIARPKSPAPGPAVS